MIMDLGRVGTRLFLCFSYTCGLAGLVLIFLVLILLCLGARISSFTRILVILTLPSPFYSKGHSNSS